MTDYQTFYEGWYNRSQRSQEPNFPNTLPYVISLREDDNTSPLPFDSHKQLGNHILVTKSYDDMFHRILRLRLADIGADVGVVLTGQPGIGVFA